MGRPPVQRAFRAIVHGEPETILRGCLSRRYVACCVRNCRGTCSGPPAAEMSLLWDNGGSMELVMGRALKRRGATAAKSPSSWVGRLGTGAKPYAD